MTPNRARVQVYEAEPIARSIRETFHAKPVKERIELPFQWPARMQHVGDSVGVAYASDKWKDDGEFEVYKHIAESRNRALCAPGFLHVYEDQGEAWPTIGPMVSFEGDVLMPKEFAVLAYFEEANLILHSRAVRGVAEFAKNPDDDVIVKVLVKHGVLGASKIRWSAIDGEQEDQPFLFVYTEPTRSDAGGVHMIIVGEELDIEKDGIVG